MQFRVMCLLLSVASGWGSVIWSLKSHCLLCVQAESPASFSSRLPLLFCRQCHSSRNVLRLLLRLWILCLSQVLLEKQHGDGNPLLGLRMHRSCCERGQISLLQLSTVGGHAALHAQPGFHSLEPTEYTWWLIQAQIQKPAVPTEDVRGSH